MVKSQVCEVVRAGDRFWERKWEEKPASLVLDVRLRLWVVARGWSFCVQLLQKRQSMRVDRVVAYLARVRSVVVR